MIKTNYKNNKDLTTWIFVVFSAVLLNLIILPCVHAASIDQQTKHDCPHCPVPKKDPCHNDNECDDCNSSLISHKAQKSNTEQDENPKFGAFTQHCHSESTNQFGPFKTKHSTEFDYHFPPIYLQNCAFLN